MLSGFFCACLLLLLLAVPAAHAQCVNRICRTQACLAKEYQNGKCANGTNVCCDRQCALGAVKQECGTDKGCFLQNVREITTPVAQQLSTCTRSVVATTTACSTNCANCVASWGQWSACSLSCGDAALGTQSRARVVTTARQGKGLACPIPASQQRAGCEPALPPCPVPCVIGSWSDWSACSGTCAPSQHKRVRTLVDAMFGAPACPAAFEVELCANQPTCEGSVMQTPFPTPPPPAETPMPTPAPSQAAEATVVVFASNLAAQFASPHPQSAAMPFELGEFLAVQSAVAGVPFFTATPSSIGCQTDAGGNAGLIKAPNGFRFEFKTRRAFARIVLAGFVDGATARLVGFDRGGRRRGGEYAIELLSGDSSLTNDGGFDTWELYPNGATEFGLQTFEVFSAIASLPTTTGGGTGGAADSTASANDTSTDDTAGEFVPSGDANDSSSTTTIIIVVCVVAVLLILAAVFGVWFMRKRNSDSDDMAASTFDPQPYRWSDRDVFANPTSLDGDQQQGGHVQYSNIPHNNYSEFNSRNVGEIQEQ
jgi:hypothetical protein